MTDQASTIPKGWKITTLGETLFPVSDTFDFKGIDKVHFLNTGDILEGKLLHLNLSPTKTLPGQAKKRFKPNDILYSEIRPANKRYMLVNFESSNSVASTKLMVLRTKENIDVKYIYKYITSHDVLNEFQVIAESRSGTFPQITFDSISGLEFILPSLPEQRAIAAVLSALDDKIELLREQNKTLEATAQGLFKEWFVNFNFPGSTGKMIDSELGAIPEGWNVGKLAELVKIKNGFAFKSEDYITIKQYPIIRTMNFEDSGYINSENLVYISNKKAEEYKSFDFDEFDLCVVMVGASLGKTALVHKINLPALQNQNMWCFKPKNKRYRFYNNFQVLDLVNLNMKSASGSARDFFRKDHFYDIDVLIPVESLILRFEEIILPIYSKISNNLSQIETISKLRDALLPKLMKGEIRVEGFKNE